jgi:peroxiredoxin
VIKTIAAARNRLGLTALLVLAVSSAVATDMVVIPRYRLQVGQELVYHERSEFPFKLKVPRKTPSDSGRLVLDSVWRIGVVRQNNDGSWHLILRQDSNDSDERYKDNKKLGRSEHKNIWITSCDLFPDGRVANESCRYLRSPNFLLPRLPKNEAEMRHGWGDAEENWGDWDTRYRVTSKGTDARHVGIEAVRRGHEQVFFGVEYCNNTSFDIQRGLPGDTDTAYKQTRTFVGEDVGTIRLEEVKMHDAAWCRQHADDADRYIRYRNTYDEIRLDNHLSKAEVVARIKALSKDVAEAKERISLADFRKPFEELLETCKDGVASCGGVAQRREETIGQPVFDWVAKGIDGKTHSQRECRGKIVILDFWYRGCQWCIRAMPQVKKIAAHFAGKPVVVLGMNGYDTEADAKVVANHMQLNYATILAKDVVSKCNFEVCWPTLVVIDQEGIIRYIHHGCTLTLEKDATEVVEGLLVEKHVREEGGNGNAHSAK